MISGHISNRHISSHTALDNVCAFMFRTKLRRTLLLSLLAMTIALNLARSKGGCMDGLLLKGSGTGMAPGKHLCPNKWRS
jgi:hypothetical protein